MLCISSASPPSVLLVLALASIKVDEELVLVAVAFSDRETVIATEFCLVRTESGLVAPTVDVAVPWGIEILTVFCGCSDKPVAVCVDVVGTVVSCRSVENIVVCG